MERDGTVAFYYNRAFLFAYDGDVSIMFALCASVLCLTGVVALTGESALTIMLMPISHLFIPVQLTN